MKKGLMLFFLFPMFLYAQTKHTLSGKITDANTGEDLIGVTIAIPETGSGTITNTYGFYSITMPSGVYKIQYSYVGFETLETSVDLSANVVRNIELAPASISLNEVVISSERRDKNISTPEIGMEKLNVRDIAQIPVIFGEKDILKTIQLLPGISSSSEGSSGFNVRGGSMDQNLILLDEASVYSASHLLGFFSVFNADAIKDVTVYKGGIPAPYGGRASSVLDITMNNGNNKNFGASGGIGLISSRLTLEGPIIKDKMSFIVSGRRTYADIVAKAIFPEDVLSDDFTLYFYDLNAKINYTINDKNRIFISGYFGSDVFGLGKDIGTSWGNTTGTFRWNHLFSDKLFSNTSVIYSNYKYAFTIGQADLMLKSGISDHSIKQDFTWFLNPANTVKFGGSVAYHQFEPGELIAGEDAEFELILEQKRSFESGVYIQNEQKITSRFSGNYGLRLSMFNQAGPNWFYEYNDENVPVDSSFFDRGELAQTFYGIEPRLSFNYMLGDRSSVKVSYNRMAQYIQLLSNSTSGLPTDVWIPASNNLKPLYVDQVSAGYFRNFLNNSLESSAEVYYKVINNVADYEDGANIFLNKHVESYILNGEGRSYGLELYLKKKQGVFTGWISYTLSRAENKIEGINDFNWYPVKYDKTHDVSIVLSYQIIPRLVASGVWVFATGNAVTFPSGKYQLNGWQIPYYTERNGYRMPDYHRLDFSLTLTGREKKKVESSWNLSVYNVYNRHNAYLIDFRESETVPGATEAVRLSLFGIVPSIGYNFKF